MGSNTRGSCICEIDHDINCDENIYGNEGEDDAYGLVRVMMMDSAMATATATSITIIMKMVMSVVITFEACNKSRFLSFWTI